MRAARDVWDLQFRAGRALACEEGCGHVDCGFVQSLCTLAREHMAILDAVEATGHDAGWLAAAVDQIVEIVDASALTSFSGVLSDVAGVLRAIDGADR